MPRSLTSRNSISSSSRDRKLSQNAASQEQQGRTRRRSSFSNLSHPSTIESATHVSEAKVMKLRRSRRQTPNVSEPAKQDDKENVRAGIERNEENLLQSPTPYWKVAMERGISPPETRSTKKKKLTKTEEKPLSPAGKKNNESTESPPNKQNGICLTFSPPDQTANAIREQKELERKKRERANRVQEAKDRGQLLVFSPTMRNPAPLPPDLDEPAPSIGNDDEDEMMPPSTSGLDEAETSMLLDMSHDGPSPSDDVSMTPENMELNVSHTSSAKSQVTSTTSTEEAARVASELKLVHESIARLESITVANNNLGDTHKQLQSSLLSEQEKHRVEKTQLEATIASMTNENLAKIATLEQSIQNLQQDKENLCDQLSTFESDATEARGKVATKEKMLETMKKEWEAERLALVEEAKQLEEVNKSMLLKAEGCGGSLIELETLKAKNEELSTRIEAYERKIDSLEKKVLPDLESQLKRALENVKLQEKVADEAKQQISEYVDQVGEMKQKLKAAHQEREEERTNFQQLNEDSSQAFEMMQQDVSSRDVKISQLESQLGEVKQSLDNEKKKLDNMSKQMRAKQSDVDSRVLDLEKSLEETRQALEASKEEKETLARKLAEALRQIDADSKIKEAALSKTKETSAALSDMVSQRTTMRSRIDELEKKLKFVTDERDDARSRLETFDDREAGLFLKLRESDRIRRDLHNRVMQLSGNIRVYVRVRPKLPGETQSEAAGASSNGKKRKHDDVDENGPFRYPGICDRNVKKSNLGADDLTKNLLEVTEPYKDRGGLSERRKKWTFGFDNVFNPDHGQRELWEATDPLVQSAIDGFNVTIFAYGSTGSGKTFTMLGEPGNEGLVYRSVQKLFEAKREIEELSRGDTKIELSVELLEIYNEKVRDLLAPNGGPDGHEIPLKVTSNDVVGNVVLSAENEQHVAGILDVAQKRRCVKATASNAVSSRSHMLFTIHFSVTSTGGVNRSGRLNICDLAGSERLGKSNANARVGGALLNETKHINTSLSVLSNVIEKLQAGDETVPYRESKLTYLLQNSLGGNSKTLAIVCCNPLTSHFHESLCSLRFAAKVNKVDLKAVANFSC